MSRLEGLPSLQCRLPTHVLYIAAAASAGNFDHHTLSRPKQRDRQRMEYQRWSIDVFSRNFCHSCNFVCDGGDMSPPLLNVVLTAVTTTF